MRRPGPTCLSVVRATLVLLPALAPLAQEPLVIPRAESRPGVAGPASRPSQDSGMVRRPDLHELGQRIAIGGYFDLEYRSQRGSDRTFRPHRLVPLLSAEVDERISFHTEIEVEDGGEVEVEFAHLDWRLDPALELRAGILLLPLGKLNLVHDSPLQELTDRPLVDHLVIPTTLSEPGAGACGRLDLSDTWACSYEGYVTSGFRGIDATGAALITRSDGLREARAGEEVGGLSRFADNNDGLAVVGRAAVQHFPGFELGVSAHSGTYDPQGQNRLTVLAADGFVNLGAVLGARDSVLRDMDLQGEWARAFVARDAGAVAAGVANDLHGYYAQWNWRLFPAFLDRLHELGVVGEGARFTLVVRRDEVVLDGAGRQRWTFGCNVRPNRDRTVIKFDYQLNGEFGSQAPAHDDAFLVSLATYF